MTTNELASEEFAYEMSLNTSGRGIGPRMRRMIRASHGADFTLVIVLACTLLTRGILCANVSVSAEGATVSDAPWGVLGGDQSHLATERATGITTKVYVLSWHDLAPTEITLNMPLIRYQQAEMARIRQAGFRIVLDLGFTDVPAWVHANYADTYYINQFGDPYIANTTDGGDANLIFNPTMRALVSAYIQSVFANFGTDFMAVRLGGGHWGELTYPIHTFGGRTNLYWAYDRNALASSPVPTWRPGQASPSGEAATFANWYMDALAAYQGWQIAALRQSYGGPIMMLYPSWGVRPGQLGQAVVGNLSGATSPEINGEVQRGYDFARLVSRINDPNVVVTTTWLDADATRDNNANPTDWSPVKYLATLAKSHPLHLGVAGENAGQGNAAVMRLVGAQMQRYELVALIWSRESELLSGAYATLDDYKRLIMGAVLPAPMPPPRTDPTPVMTSGSLLT